MTVLVEYQKKFYLWTGLATSIPSREFLRRAIRHKPFFWVKTDAVHNAKLRGHAVHHVSINPWK